MATQKVLHTGKTDTCLIHSFYLPGFRTMSWFCDILQRYPRRSEVMKFNVFDVLYSMQLLFFGEASLIWLLCHFVIAHSSYLVASSFPDDKIFQAPLVHCLMWTWKHSCLQETLDSFHGEKSLKTTARVGAIRYFSGLFQPGNTCFKKIYIMSSC